MNNIFPVTYGLVKIKGGFMPNNKRLLQLCSTISLLFFLHCVGLAQGATAAKPSKVGGPLAGVIVDPDKDDADDENRSTINIQLIPKYERAITDDPSNPVTLNNLGVVYTQEKMYGKAISAFQNAVRLDPGMSRAHTNLSVALERAGRGDEALAAAKLGADTDPTSSRAAEHLCGMYLSLKRFAGAVKCYDEIRQRSPNDPLAEANYGSILLLSGKTDEAIAVLDHLVTVAPSYLEAFNALGLAQYLRKNYRAASAAFKRSIELDPGADRTRFNLAMAELANKNRFAALSQYNLLKESNPRLASQIYNVLYQDKILFVDGK